jgi:diguanylate cyclase (GGDEF)-like protein/PAS domain S-box-containing protein
MTATTSPPSAAPANNTNDLMLWQHLALAHIDQGILVIDPQQRVRYFNAQVCTLLDLPPALLASQLTIQELTQWQSERGDFDPQNAALEASLHDYIQRIVRGDRDEPPDHYQRLTRTDRTLAVRSDTLADGSIVRLFNDITAQVHEHAAYAKLSQLTTELQILAKIGGWEIDTVNQRVTWTEGTYRIFDTTPQAFCPTLESTAFLFTPQALEVVKASYSETANQAPTHDFIIEMVSLNGRHIWVHSRGTTVWVNGRATKRTAIVQDITQRREGEWALRDSDARWKLALESVGDGVWDLQVQTGEEYFSPNLLRTFGYAEGELGTFLSELDERTHPDDIRQMHLNRQEHFDGLTPTYNNEHRVLCKDGNWKWVHSRGMVISRDSTGIPLRMIGTHTDITQRKNAEALIWQQANFDTLTGLPNRRMMRERLTQALKKCKRDGHQLALLFIDLDHFKEVNDTLGHDWGDTLLVEAARRIQNCLREVDTVARMGGDEFTVIITELTDAAHLHHILPKLLQTLSNSFQLGLDQVFVSASIGVTVSPTDGTEIENLLKNADQALYVAKGAGRNRFSFFTPAMQQVAQLRAQLTYDMRLALVAQEFRVVYQPIVELATGAIRKAEVLVRWQHPTRGLINPAEFIPVAESSGLIVALGEWVFAQAAVQVRAWRERFHPQFQISVNKSPIQFENPNPAHRPWIEQLQELGLGGDSIAVEITEGLLLSTSDGVAEQLLELSDVGINVSLDDFGTGYSSLSYLQRFDIDFIKIDQSFVRHLVADSTDLALCQAIIAMAHALGMKVVAEGVETELQRDLLTASGCDFGQGYLFSRPVPAADFEALMFSVASSTPEKNHI